METIRLPFKERACVFVNKDGNKVIVHPGGHTYDCTPNDLPVMMKVVSSGMNNTDAELVIHPVGSWIGRTLCERGVIVSGDHCSYVCRPDLGCTGTYLTRATPDEVTTDKDYEECAINSIHYNMLNEIAHGHRAPVKLSTYRVGIDHPCSAITVAMSLRGKNAWMRFSYLRLDEGVTEHYVSIIDNKLVYQGDEEHMYLKWLAESGHGDITTRVTTYDQSCANSYIITVGGINDGAACVIYIKDEGCGVVTSDPVFCEVISSDASKRFKMFLNVIKNYLNSNARDYLKGIMRIEQAAVIAFDTIYVYGEFIRLDTSNCNFKHEVQQ